MTTRGCRVCAEPLTASARFCGRCGAPTDLLAPIDADDFADPWLGRVVGTRYRVVRILGVGGSGRVYEVEHVHLGLRLAMKVLAFDAPTAAAAARLRREAQSVVALDHPSIVPVFELGVHEGRPFLVMQLARGATLAEVLEREGPMDEGRVVELVREVAGGLHVAHLAGIVHRDLKAENLVLERMDDGRERLRILDFGLASRDDTLAATAPDGARVVGTPYVMAPEQIRGERVTPATDVYALGCVIVRMRTGQHPFPGDDAVAVLRAHLERPAPTLASRGAPSSPALESLVARMLDKDPAARPTDGGAVARALGANVEHVTGHAHAHPADDGLRQALQVYARGERRRRTAFRALAVAAGCGVVALAAASFFVEPPDDGGEREPNDTPATASPLAPATARTGHHGRRRSPGEGDVDVFVFTLEADTTIDLELSALPNVDLRLDLFADGRASPLVSVDRGGTGAPERLLGYPAAAGRYLAVVLEPPRGGRPVENVSDTYTLTLQPSALGGGEPDDHPDRARTIGGGRHRAALGWAGDRDVVCGDAGLYTVVPETSLDVALLALERDGSVRATRDEGVAGAPESTWLDAAGCVGVVAGAAARSTDAVGIYSLAWSARRAGAADAGLSTGATAPTGGPRRRR